MTVPDPARRRFLAQSAALAAGLGGAEGHGRQTGLQRRTRVVPKLKPGLTDTSASLHAICKRCRPWGRPVDRRVLGRSVRHLPQRRWFRISTRSHGRHRAEPVLSQPEDRGGRG